jgi:hypothetical protein
MEPLLLCPILQITPESFARHNRNPKKNSKKTRKMEITKKKRVIHETEAACSTGVSVDCSRKAAGIAGKRS